MTEKLYVLGHPVAHSKSPAMHNAAYRALGLNWEYGFADQVGEPDARAFLARRDWLALNVTMPYKPLAYETAAWRSEAARLARGANVLIRRGDELLADNTDGKGCVSYLRRCGVTFEGARVVVCGTGPTSLAITHAVAAEGAAAVALLGRDAARSARALDAYRERAAGAAEAAVGQAASASQAAVSPPARICAHDGASGASAPSAASSAPVFQSGSYARSHELIAQADVIIDATPLGMREGDPAPFDTALLAGGQVVFDVVYGHGETALIGAARAVGCTALDGAGMLVAQAVETVADLVSWLSLPIDLSSIDLFPLMASAAGFDSASCGAPPLP